MFKMIIFHGNQKLINDSKRYKVIGALTNNILKNASLLKLLNNFSNKINGFLVRNFCRNLKA